LIFDFGSTALFCLETRSPRAPHSPAGAAAGDAAPPGGPRSSRALAPGLRVALLHDPRRRPGAPTLKRGSSIRTCSPLRRLFFNPSKQSASLSMRSFTDFAGFVNVYCRDTLLERIWFCVCPPFPPALSFRPKCGQSTVSSHWTR